MTRLQTKRKPHHAAKHLRLIREDNLHPVFGDEKPAVKFRIHAADVARLKKLADENGTTVARELKNAVEAYGAGVSRREIRLINAFIDCLNASMDRNSLALAELLREAEKSRTRFTRKPRRGRSGMRRP